MRSIVEAVKRGERFKEVKRIDGKGNDRRGARKAQGETKEKVYREMNLERS